MTHEGNPPRPQRRRQLEINIGKRCNNDCVFCGNGTVAPEDRRDVPLRLIRREIDEAAAQGYGALGLLGGEPTVHPDLEEAVAYARDLGFGRISLCTNGRRLRGPDLLDRLVAAGITRITLSLHSHRANQAERLSNRPGSFAQQLAAIDHIVRGMQDSTRPLPHGFAINTCVHGGNVGQLLPLARFLKRRGVRDIRLNFLRPEHRAEGDAQLIPPLPRVTAAMEELVAWNERRGRLHLTFGDFPWCAYPEAFFLNPTLVRRYVGDRLDRDTFVTAFRGVARTRERFRWKESRTHRLKEKIPGCAQCRMEPLCEGVWRRYRDVHGDAGIKPIR